MSERPTLPPKRGMAQSDNPHIPWVRVPTALKRAAFQGLVALAVGRRSNDGRHL